MRLLLATLVLVLLAACGTTDPGERRGTSDQPFTSADASLYDFTFDGRLTATAGDAVDPKRLVLAQLAYAIGQLNGDRSVGRDARLDLSAIELTPRTAGDVEITYHARLPVAWGGEGAPKDYTFVLPARVGAQDQVAFQQKYASACADAAVGLPSIWNMFLVYRPQSSGCELDEADVVRFGAKAAPSSEQTTGKYPEYQRMWEDGVLSIVLLVSRDIETEPQDEGIQTFQTIEQQVQDYLSARQPDVTRRLDPALTIGPSTRTPVKIGATLDDGRRVVVDMRLVPHTFADGGPELDAWFAGVTRSADVMLYNGHAGLGENIRTISQKGSFRPRQYVVWGLNGCDTFAYLDRTLTERHAAVNPDDPSGTRTMDQVLNVMPGYFKTAPAYAMSFLDATVSAGDPTGTPKSYAELLDTIDAGQVSVVVGEEDNVFDPTKQRAWTPGQPVIVLPDAPAGGDAGTPGPGATTDGGQAAPPGEPAAAPGPAATPAPGPAPSQRSGCAAGGTSAGDSGTGAFGFAFAVAGLVAIRGRARRHERTR